MCRLADRTALLTLLFSPGEGVRRVCCLLEDSGYNASAPSLSGMFGKVGLCTSLVRQTTAGSSGPVHATERTRVHFPPDQAIS